MDELACPAARLTPGICPIVPPNTGSSRHGKTAVCGPLTLRQGARFAAGVILGVATQGLFLVTVWQLFAFLKGGLPEQPGSLWWDVLLAAQFAIPHSGLLLPRTKRWLGRWVSPAFYGLLFCVVTCVSLLLTFSYWKTCSLVVWEAHGLSRELVECGYYGSWIALFYSLWLSGLGYQTGLTPWWYWLRGKPQPRRGFEVRGAYRVLRHPIYFSFLGLIWFTPKMTLDHAILTGLWTVYIFVGSRLKDERLTLYLGDSYQQYRERIPGFGFQLAGRKRRRLAFLKSASAKS